MRDALGELQMSELSAYNWGYIRGYDAAFFQRPYKKEHLQVIEMCKDMGKKVWVDYDDYLHGVPTDNPAHSIYNKKETQEIVYKCIAMADQVSVSTEELRRQYLKLNKNITTIRNCIPMDLFKWRNNAPSIARTKSISWRGSRTHQRDLMTFAKEIISASHDKRFQEWVWYFIGDSQWMATDHMPHERTIWTEPMDPILYFLEMYRVAPSCMQVPLHDNLFNRCKSNIAWLEATFAGAAAIVPDWEEWKHPGTLNYSSQEQYLTQLEAVMSGQVDVEANAKLSMEYIGDSFNLEIENLKRIEIIKKICDV